MHNISHLRDRLLDAAISSCHPLLREWVPPERLRENLGQEIGTDLRRHTEPDFAQACHDALAIPGREPDDYRQRCLELDGEVIIADIAFLGGDVSRPFVNVTHRTLPIDDATVRQVVCDRVAQEFACFRPQRVSVPQASHLPYQFVDCEQDMRLLAAPLAVIRATDIEVDRLHIRQATDLSWYDTYALEYEEMRRARPNVRDVAHPESRESLQELLDLDGVFEVMIDDEWAGIYAVRPTMYAGMDGLLVHEILLAAAARGQGLGPAIHVLHARRSTRPDSECVMGTIGAVNGASLRAAKHAGRVDLGGNYWVDIPVT